MGVKVVCTIHPRKGKEDRAWELQNWLASQVKEKESAVTSYKYGRGDGTYGGKDIVVVMEYVFFLFPRFLSKYSLWALASALHRTWLRWGSTVPGSVSLRCAALYHTTR